jgi:hypothetical protein
MTNIQFFVIGLLLARLQGAERDIVFAQLIVIAATILNFFINGFMKAG